MNERVRMNENGARPDEDLPAPNPYYFPPASYAAAPPPYPRQPPIPQGYQQHQHPGAYPYPHQHPQQAMMPPYAAPQGYQPAAPAYAAPSYHQAPPPAYGYAPTPPPAPYAAAPEAPAASGNVDDAVAQIAARIRALDSDPADARPFAPASPPPAPAAPVSYGQAADAYAPPAMRQPAHYAPPLAPSYQPEPAYHAEPQRYAEPARPAPGPDLSGLETQLRNLTAQIETLRQPMPDFSGVLQELRADLSDISNRLVEAMPRRAVDALEAEVRRLADRIDDSRAAGVDPDAIAGMERSLNDVREAIRSLKPAESFAGFEQAIRNLSDRIDQSAGAYQDPASLRQLESSIVALRGIVSNVASNDALAGLSEEIRGLSAQVERAAASSRTFDSEMLHTLEQRIANLPVLGAIERGFAELKARFEQIPFAAPQQIIDPTPAVDHLKRDLVRTQDSLEAVHSTLGHLVDRLAMIEGGIREARFAAEMPAPMPVARAAAIPVPPAAPQMPKPEMPRMAPPVVAPHAAPAPAAHKPQPADMPHAAQKKVAALDALATTIAPALAPQIPQSNSTAQAAREHDPIDPTLPPDFPLEPGSRGRSPASAAERIAASEAALGNAKPGAGNPGSTNFIAAARRAAQAAAATPDLAPGNQGEAADKRSAKSITKRVRALFVGAGAILLIAGAARVAIDMIDFGGPALSEFTTPAEFDTAEAPEPQDKPTPGAAQIALAPKPDLFATPPSGVMERPRPVAPVPAPAATSGSTGSLGPFGKPLVNPVVETASPVSRGPLPAMPDKLPVALRNAASKGQAAAEFEVGIRQIEGRGVPQNAEAGLRWLERAALSGLAPAHFRIAGLYEKGIGVKKDLSVARQHYVAAAEKGNAKAMHNLAVLYAEGIDGKPDYKTAAEWFRRASDFGIADSQYNLAILYARGIGVDQNILESYKWLALAALQGDNDAAKKRDEIASKLDPASLAAARAAVQSFAAQPQPEDAVTVVAPAGGWDRPAAESTPAKKPRSGSVARVTAL